jgi:tripartite ATP-independent transporter DctP family solute receptor
MKRRAFAAGLGALAAPALARRATTLTAADVHPTSYPTVNAVRWLASQLDAASSGALRIKQYPSAQLGRESDTIDLVRIGALSMTRVFAAGINNAVPLTTVLGLPYVFRSVAHQRACLDGAIGEAVLAALEPFDLKGLALYDAGARHFYSQRPLTDLQSLKGRKIRVPVSDLFIELLRALGANPTPLAFGAVYSALETGLIDGAENNLRSFFASRHFEAAKVLSLSAHSYAPDVLVMSLRQFRALGLTEQALLVRLGRESVAQMRRDWDSGEAEALTGLIAAGVQIAEVDRDALAARAVAIEPRFVTSAATRDLCAQIRSEQRG